MRPKAERRLTLTLAVGVRDVEFSVLGTPSEDNKGLTELGVTRAPPSRTERWCWRSTSGRT